MPRKREHYDNIAFETAGEPAFRLIPCKIPKPDNLPLTCGYPRPAEPLPIVSEQARANSVLSKRLVAHALANDGKPETAWQPPDYSGLTQDELLTLVRRTNDDAPVKNTKVQKRHNKRYILRNTGITSYVYIRCANAPKVYTPMAATTSRLQRGY